MDILREWTPAGLEEPSNVCRNSSTPVVVDLGTAQTRFGLASSSKPEHVFLSKAARFRDRKSGEQRQVVGNDVLLDQFARNNARSPFDGPLLVNWDAAEGVLDYGFELMGYTASQSAPGPAPVAVSEPLLAPSLPRRTLQELLFEGYNVPALAFGADVLGAANFNFNLNTNTNTNTNSKSNTKFDSENFLLVHLGNETTTIVPILNGVPQLDAARRIGWGGRLAAEYLHELLVLKYPTFPTPVNVYQVREMMHSHCFVAKDYKQFAREVMDLDFLVKHERIIQSPPAEQPKIDVQKLERQMERRKESGKRLQEQAAAARAQKLLAQEEELLAIRNLESRLLHELESKEDAEIEARAAGFIDLADVHRTAQRLETQLRRAKGESVEEKPPSTPLLDIDDSELTEEQIQQKKKQRLLRASYDARQRAKAAKQAENEALAAADAEEAAWRERDLRGWADAKKEQLQDVMAQISEREKQKEKADPRSRFRDTLMLQPPSKRKADTEDEVIARMVEGADDEDGNEEKQPLDLDVESARLKGLLLEFDPEFSVDELEPKVDWRGSIVHKFLWGAHAYDAENVEQQYQLNLNVERCRVYEPLFDPSMVGLDQAGLGEVCAFLLKQFPSLASSVRLSGGFARMQGLPERLTAELRAALPTTVAVSTSVSAEPELDAWRGIAEWAQNADCYVSRSEYNEKGSEYMKEHKWGNPL